MKLPEEIRKKFVAAGRKGGKKSMKQLTDEQRRELASRAGKASAAKRKKETQS